MQLVDDAIKRAIGKSKVHTASRASQLRIGCRLFRPRQPLVFARPPFYRSQSVFILVSCAFFYPCFFPKGRFSVRNCSWLPLSFLSPNVSHLFRPHFKLNSVCDGNVGAAHSSSPAPTISQIYEALAECSTRDREPAAGRNRCAIEPKKSLEPQALVA